MTATEPCIDNASPLYRPTMETGCGCDPNGAPQPIGTCYAGVPVGQPSPEKPYYIPTGLVETCISFATAAFTE